MSGKISEIIGAAADKAEVALKENSVFGDPITIDDTVIVPVFSLSFGFGGGAFDGVSNKNDASLVGGAAAGVTKKPVAYLTLKDGEVTLLGEAQKNDGFISKILSFASKKGK